MDPHSLSASFLTITITIFATAAVIGYLFERLRLPTVLAFILTGVLLGPVFRLVEPAQVEVLAQIGVIFLLFVVGLELSFDKIGAMRLQAPLAGILQLGLTTVFLTLLLFLFGKMPLQLAFLLGAILSLSSTAIVLKSLEDNRRNDTHYGRLVLGILIIQDLSIVPLMTLVPVLLQPLQEDLFLTLGWTIFKALIFAAIAVLVAIRFVPYFLDRIASANRKDIFILALVCVGLGMALFTNQLGLSYEAGAFVAGIALSESVFSRQVLSDSRGFRDVFVTLFFVSMGLLFNVDFMLAHWPVVLAVTLALILIKAVGAFLAVSLLRFSARTAAWTAVSLFQVGEFSFVLLGRTLEEAGQVPAWQQILEFWNPVLINAIIITMFLTPLAIRFFPAFLEKYGRNVLQAAPEEEAAKKEDRDLGKVIIAGYGPTAQNLVMALSRKEIPFVIVEMNLNTVKHLRKCKIPCIYGDVSHPEILKEAGVTRASILAVTFPDIRTSEVAVERARQLNPEIRCLARCRYRPDIDRLLAAGADSIIYEEFETSVSFVFNILQHLDYPVTEIDQLIGMIRRSEPLGKKVATYEEQAVFGRFSILEGTKIEWLELTETSPLVGCSLSDCQIRSATGANVIAIVDAEKQAQVSPEPALKLKAHDVLVAVGTVEQLHALEELVSGRRAGSV